MSMHFNICLFIQISINFWTYTVFQTLGSHSVSDLYPCQCKNERKYFSSFLTKIFFHIYDSNIFPRKQILKLFPNATFREVIFQSICHTQNIPFRNCHMILSLKICDTPLRCFFLKSNSGPLCKPFLTVKILACVDQNLTI